MRYICSRFFFRLAAFLYLSLSAAQAGDLAAGKAKAEPTVLKTRRVLRLALVWAQEQGWIAEAPIPEAYRQRKVKKNEA